MTSSGPNKAPPQGSEPPSRIDTGQTSGSEHQPPNLGPCPTQVPPSHQMNSQDRDQNPQVFFSLIQYLIMKFTIQFVPASHDNL